MPEINRNITPANLWSIKPSPKQTLNGAHMKETWRWFGPKDTVTLANIRQAGASA
ncbi:hypothetical protein [Gilvimarinus chinensis]|uniref:hypothetical protein n=1 Tax=Gilvimarinus chinensis TaxID=396005 RepID=UPI0003A2B0CE